MRYVPTSASKVDRLKKQTKRLQRNGGGKHAELLDRVARGAGYDHWHHVTKCLEAAHSLEGVALLRREIEVFQKLAVKGAHKITVTGSDMLAQPMIMFAAEGDAWLLDPHQQECICLAFHGEPIQPEIKERGLEVDLGFHGTYRIGDDAMFFDTTLPQVGRRTVEGFPLAGLREATKRATESFEDKFASVFLQADAVELTPEVIEHLLERGFGDYDRRELDKHAKDGARYSPARDALLYPPVTGTQAGAARGHASTDRHSAVRWTVAGDPAEHPKTAAVLNLLSVVHELHQGSDGNKMVVSFESGRRQAIIQAETRGLAPFIALIDGLQALGLQDRLADAKQSDRGIDAAFS